MPVHFTAPATLYLHVIGRSEARRPGAWPERVGCEGATLFRVCAEAG